jgi:hypothetical protein
MYKQTKTPTNPNAGIDGLRNFDWGNPVIGDVYKAYVELFGKLRLNEKYYFEEWLATSIQKFRVNEDTGEKESYIAGITIHGNKPINTTLITVANANVLNSFVTHNLSERANSRIICCRFLKR